MGYLIQKNKGSAMIWAIGITLASFVVTPIAIDLPMFYNVQQQLQTAVDSAALAGAAKLPEGSTQATSAALDIISKNWVAGRHLNTSEVTLSSTGSAFNVTGRISIPTLTRKLMCSLNIGSGSVENTATTNPGGVIGGSSSAAASCADIVVGAKSKAIPAARDTMLVIDTSSSMDDLGNGRPFKDVKSAAKLYLSLLSGMSSESVDKVGLVSFNQTGKLESGLISQFDSPLYATLASKVDGLKLFTGTGWNTNYESGLKLALNELESKGRKNSSKIVIFMTDGLPNLPAPATHYAYSQFEPYRKCTDPVNNSTAVKALCTRNSSNQLVCPTLPNAKITDAMISSTVVTCGMEYTNFMESSSDVQAQRAKALDVTIHTIRIYNNQADNAIDILKRVTKRPTWFPNILENFTGTTKGSAYLAPNYDAVAINNIYKKIAEDIRVRLSQ
jgi:hypothetical protein